MKKLFLTFALLLASACTSSSSSGTKVDAATLTQFQRGVTTYDQVVGVLGQPNNSSTMPDGSKMAMYVATRMQHEVNPFAAFSGGTTSSMAQSSVTFVFDANNVLKYYTSSQNSYGVGGNGVSFR